MRKLQVTEFPKRVYRQIEAHASRTGPSVEDEVRMRLVHLYSLPPVYGDEILPARMRWRKAVGIRITWIWRCLTEDGLLPGDSWLAHLAASLDIRADWLLCGTSPPFR